MHLHIINYKINIPFTDKFASLIMIKHNNKNFSHSNSASSIEVIDNRERNNNIKRLIYRSKNRGCKENDLLLGNFAEQELYNLSDDDLEVYQLFIEENDNDILCWLTARKTAKEKYKDLISKILNMIK
ncbi:MAG: succinate dehydrogenase assembly factor 2 [Rickettsiaceae bacterium]|jgi:succinate dehydrogenase flavin-adding protein (antitoxin of CptAB toxin-antitoxin module)|nr:succinate dehydrogenase assembly factor 2 [Rickettsiaceae bacterium]